MSRQNKRENPKPRLNPNDSRFTTKTVPSKRKKISKEFCKNFKYIEYED